MLKLIFHVFSAPQLDFPHPFAPVDIRGLIVVALTCCQSEKRRGNRGKTGKCGRKWDSRGVAVMSWLKWL